MEFFFGLACVIAVAIYVVGLFISIMNENIDHNQRNIVLLFWTGIRWPIFAVRRLRRDARSLNRVPNMPGINLDLDEAQDQRSSHEVASTKEPPYEPGKWIN